MNDFMISPWEKLLEYGFIGIGNIIWSGKAVTRNREIVFIPKKLNNKVTDYVIYC